MKKTLAATACLLLPVAAHAAEWKPAAELGLVVTTGNSDTTNINGKFALHGEDETWIHDFGALYIRGETDDETTANRYELSGRSGYKFSERSYVFGSLRYENDDFAAFDYQAVAAIGYGYFAIKSELTSLLFEIGPGWRQAELIDGTEENGVIVRGMMDFKHQFTESTAFFETLLVEAGSDNTFVQNDIGIAVAINKTLALKASLQARHNTDVLDGIDKTDTLTTVNLVWSPE
jgi:putative salt-induced outer membrane protein